MKNYLNLANLCRILLLAIFIKPGIAKITTPSMNAFLQGIGFNLPHAALIAGSAELLVIILCLIPDNKINRIGGYLGIIVSLSIIITHITHSETMGFGFMFIRAVVALLASIYMTFGRNHEYRVNDNYRNDKKMNELMK